jgi:PKD domain
VTCWEDLAARTLRTTRLLPVLVFLIVAGSGAAPQPAAAQAPSWAQPTVVDGPSPNIIGLSGLSVARDGTGGLVYLKDVRGAEHVFVSRLVGGAWQPPEQVDGAFSGSSSQPVIAAGNGGVLVIAFINGGGLRVVDRTSAGAAYAAPQDLFNGASNPSIEMTPLGKTYIAFTAADGGGDDVRTAYYWQNQWSLEPTPLNVVAADDAGTGSGSPAVAAAGDGVAIVVWGENGHIYSRRVWGDSPSVVYEQADVPSLSGWSELTAVEPAVATGGDSSYADVTFREEFTNGITTQDRVLVNRLHGSVYDDFTGADGLSTPGSDGADEPQDSNGEYGSGFVLSAREGSNQLWATQLGTDGAPAQTFQADSLQNTTPPYGTSSMDGLYSGVLAWQETPPLGTPEIRARFYNGSSLGPETVISSPSLGPTDAAGGLGAAGDLNGDAAVAWVQGTGFSSQIVAAQLYQAPGSIAVPSTPKYLRTTRPTLSWSPVKESWGPVQYTVSLDGTPLTTTTATAVAPPVPLSQGAHTWQVTGTNPAGLSTSTHTTRLFVDTIPPIVQLVLSGKLQIGATIRAHLSYTDAPPPLPPADASGIASLTFKWGDGTTLRITGGSSVQTHVKSHVYTRAGRYKLTVTVADRAGNTTKLTHEIEIVPKPKPTPKPKKKPAKKGHSRDTGRSASVSTSNARA